MDNFNLTIKKKEVDVDYSKYFYVEINKKNTFYEIIKRIFDIVFSTILLTVTLPIMILVSILIKLESPGPLIYKQTRVGLQGKLFTIYKFRSMVNDSEKHYITWARQNDDRITRVGKFIRKTRIDELPQLINVIKGDMSIIGPRPERPEFTLEFCKIYPNFKNRLAIKPGMTGLAQVNGGYDLSPKEKLEYDIEYIQNRSLLLDLKILIKTVKVIFTFEGAR